MEWYDQHLLQIHQWLMVLDKNFWLCKCHFLHEICVLYLTAYKLHTFLWDRTCKFFWHHKFCEVHFYWCENDFQSGILCSTNILCWYKMSIPSNFETVHFIAIRLCLEVPFPISSIIAFCQKTFLDLIFRLSVYFGSLLTLPEVLILHLNFLSNLMKQQTNRYLIVMMFY